MKTRQERTHILSSVTEWKFTWRADAWSPKCWAFLLHSSFSLLCLSSSAEYMAFSSVRTRKLQIYTQIQFYHQQKGVHIAEVDINMKDPTCLVGTALAPSAGWKVKLHTGWPAPGRSWVGQGHCPSASPLHLTAPAENPPAYWPVG